MSVLIRVFIPETGKKTQLLYNDLQQIREWTRRNCNDETTLVIYKSKDTYRECVFLEKVLCVFGSWKNIRIH